MSYRGKLVWLALLCACARSGPPTFGPKDDASLLRAGAGGKSATSQNRARPSAADADGGSADPAGGAGGARAAAGGGGKAAAAGGSGAAANGGAAAGGANAAQGASAKQGIKTSDEVFRDDMLRTYDLTFSDADWQKLQDTATEEQFVPAVLSVNGEQIGKIGVRYKGATGTLQGCFSNGVQTCRKLSMKMKFDAYDPNLRYRGLKKLNLHSSMNDGSHLHERLTYQLFREFGVLAPRSVHARLNINGEYKGLYNLTEEVDGRFTDYHFQGEDGQGTLYKEAWPSSSQDPGYFTHAQQTNEGTPVTKIVEFAQDLAMASEDQLGDVVRHWMDPDLTLRYLAVHSTTKHWDGPLTFYCTEEYGCNNHNYFLYEAVTQERFAIVAWDVDNTFYENVLTDQAGLPSWYEPVADCDHQATDGFLAPGCDRLVKGFVQLGLDKFRTIMGTFLQGPYQVDKLKADVDRWAAQIDESVKSDPAGSGYDDWRGNVEYLKMMIEKRHIRAQMIRDATE